MSPGCEPGLGRPRLPARRHRSSPDPKPTAGPEIPVVLLVAEDVATGDALRCDGDLARVPPSVTVRRRVRPLLACTWASTSSQYWTDRHPRRRSCRRA